MTNTDHEFLSLTD